MRIKKAWVICNPWQCRTVTSLSGIVWWQDSSDWLHKYKKDFLKAILYYIWFRVWCLFRIFLTAKAKPSVQLSDANVASSDS